MPWEEEHALTLHNALNSATRVGAGDVLGGVGTLASPRSARTTHPSTLTHPPTVILFIGPEGGLTPEEVSLAQRHGVQVVTLGNRILRAETAALATIANVMYEMEQ
jgi:16S rRNA U1498 N3-methylase RsmE